eukprot:365436-Chlamydomonas_euryale.AAC.4
MPALVPCAVCCARSPALQRLRRGQTRRYGHGAYALSSKRSPRTSLPSSTGGNLRRSRQHLALRVQSEEHTERPCLRPATRAIVPPASFRHPPRGEPNIGSRSTEADRGLHVRSTSLRRRLRGRAGEDGGRLRVPFLL